ncbi:MAG: peptide deformylase, partial [Oscillospiraceae bacterium]|nr:peptide deformylase [Oscillospiraceae bacterium]
MIKELVHDPIFLALKSEEAVKEDMPDAQDLLDTITAHKETCVGMACNMIGVRKKIICFSDSGKFVTMFNPEIIKAEQPYETEEGCLSLLGGPRPVTRYKNIKVRYQTNMMQTRI